MADDCDTVVIGSGFGGAVAACRLTQRGDKVVVLERGRRWQTDAFPRGPGDDWIYDINRPERANGWIDMRVFPDIAVVQGAGVGGGSLIYANVFVPAQAAAFADGWPPEITLAELQPHYATTGAMLDVAELPDGQLTGRHRLMRDAAAATGNADRLRKLPLAVRFDPAWSYDLPDPHAHHHSSPFVNRHGKAQGTCVHCGDCDLGCPVGARNTLDLNYLAVAEAGGADIRPLHMVVGIEPEGRRYRVYFDRVDQGRRARDSIVAGRVVLAAGSLNSTELLLRCRDVLGTLPDLSPRLGQGWCANGDFLTLATYGDRSVGPTRGPTITTAVDFLDGSDGGHRYFVEDGGFPDVVSNALREMLGRNTVTKRFFRLYERALGALAGGRPLDGVMPWFGQGADASNGVMRIERDLLDPDGWSLDLEWDPAPSSGVVNALIDRHRQFTRATGGRIIEPLIWRIFDYLITPHPLGGCGMGTDRTTGVVDHAGEVFGYPRLHVLDGSIVPRALGLNPSRTIAALAERNVALMQ
ncbi:cholesterol oxidase [Stella humosa]|uniref:Cholesterol oxidase n=1 Tax=Stella humosa TaxID=94 RepID=A0A3N1KWI6_9PROT|nr:GMC oxidoreductase [Stella humosa]ROP83607.1 cholesterol oxidase [Stella humosa]